MTGAQTAIRRKKPSAPLRWLLEKNMIIQTDTVLDFGCGRGTDVDYLGDLGFEVLGWDPAHHPTGYPIIGASSNGILGEYHPFPCRTVLGAGVKQFDVVLATYVANVILDPDERRNALNDAYWALKPGGWLFATVRRDVPREGTETQRWVELHGRWCSWRKTSSYELYAIRRTTV